MKFSKFIIGALFAISLVACEESGTIGESVIQGDIDIVIDSAYTINGRSSVAPRVQSRTTTQLLGIINAKGFGTLRSDVVTQFMPSVDIDTAGVAEEDIDSIKLVMCIHNGGYTGDSIAPMGVKVYQLNKQLPSPIYSDFSPADYYSSDSELGSTIYTASALGLSDSIAALNYRSVEVMLPLELGKKFYRQYKTNPATFSTPMDFAAWFPGLYITNSYGVGRVMHFKSTDMRIYYHQHDKVDDRDTTYYKTGVYFAVTPEIVTNNNIEMSVGADVQALVDAGEAIVLAPTGLDVEVKFPAREIVANYNANRGLVSVVNTLTMEIPVEKVANDYGINPPPYLLMVQSSKKEEFFADDDITDNKTSFYAAYNPSTGKYIFTGMRDYILSLIEKDEITDDDITFTLTPVNVITESSYSSNGYYSSTTTQYVTDICPYVDSPAMVRLLLDKAKIKFTYSKQTMTF